MSTEEIRRQTDEAYAIIKEFKEVMGNPDDYVNSNNPIGKAFMSYLEKVKAETVTDEDLAAVMKEVDRIKSLNQRINSYGNRSVITDVITVLNIPFFWNILEELNNSALLVELGVAEVERRRKEND